MFRSSWLVSLCRILGLGIMVGAAGCGPMTNNPTKSAPATSTPATQPATRQSADAKVDIQVTNTKVVVAQIAEQKGNIVVVDTWATWCGPCKEEFPHLVQIYREHAKDGVVCMSVSLDQVEQRDAALKFLQSKDATFPNFLIDEETGWQDKWNIKAIPMVLVFGRDGRLARKFDRDDPDNLFTYADVEKFVDGLIRKGK